MMLTRLLEGTSLLRLGCESVAVQALGITTTPPWTPILTDKSLALSPTRSTLAIPEQWRDFKLQIIQQSNLDMATAMAIMLIILP